MNRSNDSWYQFLDGIDGIHKRSADGYPGTPSSTNRGSALSRADGASPFFSALAKIGETVISGLDFPQRLTLSGILELPFKKSGNRLVGLFATGWQLQAWYEGQSGEALGFGNTAFRGNLADIAYPANQRFPTRWFNIDAGFERDAAKALGNNLQTLSTRFTGVRALRITEFVRPQAYPHTSC